MPTFSLGGVGSGIDTGSLITGLMNVANLPLTQLQSRKSNVDSASQTISTLATKLSALKTAALALTSSTGFASYSATSSDASVVASVSGSANAANYSVDVIKLAQAQKTRSDSFLSSNTALGQAGSFDIVIGGKTTAVSISVTDTLADVANRISSSGARVAASVMNDGTGYRLIVQGLDTGATNNVTINENSVVFGLSTPSNTYQSAQDASLMVDGLPITSKTNQVTGVIAGVTLALTKATTTSTIVSVAGDSSAIKAKINAFVSAYNDFVTSSHTAAGFGSAKATNPLLSGDASIRAATTRLGQVAGQAVSGTTGLYRTLGSVGLALKTDGTMSFDLSKFDKAIQADPSNVSRIFVTDATTGATGLMKNFMTLVDSLNSGSNATLQARMDGLSAQSKVLDNSVTRMQGRLDQYRAQLTKQFTAMDQAVSRYQATLRSFQAATGTSTSTSTSNNSSGG